MSSYNAFTYLVIQINNLDQQPIYRISLIRHRGYYLLRCSFCAATIRGRLLFEGGVYFFWKPEDINDGWIRYVRVRWWRLQDTVSSTRSLSVLLSAVGTTCRTQTVLCARVVTVIRNHSHTCACAMFTSCGCYSRVAFILIKSFEFCSYYSRAATIQGRQLFEGGKYSKKYGKQPT